MTNNQLRGALTHVAYTIWMLRETEGRLQHKPDDLIIRNALLESFLVHYRNLWSFFLAKRNKWRDPIANDYTSARWAPTVTSEHLTKPTYERVHRTLAHVTSQNFSEHRDGDKCWKHRAMCCAMLDLVEEFRRALSPQWHEDWLDRSRISAKWDAHNGHWVCDLKTALE